MSFMISYTKSLKNIKFSDQAASINNPLDFIS